jgi:hypothetical protein
MMGALVQGSKQLSRGWLVVRFLCAAITATVVYTALPASSVAAEPSPPSIGAVSGENLSIGLRWGLYEEVGAQVQDSIGIVSAPMPFIMQLMDNGEHRLFIFVQRRASDHPYCAESPAQLEDVAEQLTAAGGDPTTPGPGYLKTYVWTPAEAGEYALCTYLDATADARPVAINFLKLTADPAPGSLAIAVTPETEMPERSAVKVEGTALVSSELTASVQEKGLPCLSPEGQLAGDPLSMPPGSAVGPGPFVTSYSFAAAQPGEYEVCAYLTPESTTGMYYGRPYEVGRGDFSVAETQSMDDSAQELIMPTVARPPVLSAVAMSNRRFRVTPNGARGAQSAGNVPLGTKFHFAVSAPATVAIAISRLLPGVRQGRNCVRLRAGVEVSPQRRCTRRTEIGSVLRPLPLGGTGEIAFKGTVNHRRLLAGTYSATVTASNPSGRSNAVDLRFGVAR